MSFEVVTYKRDLLYEEVWAESMLTVAKRYRISSVALAKVCKKLRVPFPGRGYWARVAAGKDVEERPPLPALRPGDPSELKVPRRHAPLVALRTAIEEKLREEKNPAAAIVVGKKLSSPHPLVETAAGVLGRPRAKVKTGSTLLRGDAANCLDVAVSERSLDRALRILDALLKALEARGYPVEVKGPEVAESGRRRGGRDDDDEASRRPVPPSTTRVLVGEDWIRFGLFEGEELANAKERRIPADLPIWKRLKFEEGLPPPIYRPTGILTLEIKRDEIVYARRRWKDTRTQRLENCLNDFVRNLLMTAESLRAEREERARRDRHWEEEADRRRRAEEARQREEARVKLLRSEVERWSFARSVREYVADPRARMDVAKYQMNIEGGIPFEEWLTWAAAYADRIDPLRVELPEEGE